MFELKLISELCVQGVPQNMQHFVSSKLSFSLAATIKVKDFPPCPIYGFLENIAYLNPKSHFAKDIAIPVTESHN